MFYRILSKKEVGEQTDVIGSNKVGFWKTNVKRFIQVRNQPMLNLPNALQPAPSMQAVKAATRGSSKSAADIETVDENNDTGGIQL